MSQFNYGVLHKGTGQVIFNGTLGDNFKMHLHDYVTLTIGTNATISGSATALKGLLLTMHDGSLANAGYDSTPTHAMFAVLSGHVAPGDGAVGSLKIVCSHATWNCSSAANAAWRFDVAKGNQSDKLEIVGNFKKGAVGSDGFCFDFGGSEQGGHFDLVSWTGTSDF